MQPEDLQARWNAQGEEIFAAVAQWRAAHPKATLAEIEHAVDEQMNRLRARMIEQAAQASAAESQASQGLVCEQCEQPLQARGRAKRRWQPHGGQQVEVERTYVTCPRCGGVAIGEVERRKRKDEEQIVTTQITYFARMANAATFADQASAELRRRGIERAKEVCAIQDGAEWIQGFVQGHRHDALRILDAGACRQLRL